jgi:hypothetical protein
MKNFLSIGLLATAFFFVSNPEAAAQKAPKKASLNIEISGNCGMCERRINNALDVPGVLVSSWDRYTKKAEIIYNPRKISEEKIHELIAGAGHDTNKEKAKTEVYTKLPGCCLYRENNNPHED